MLLESASPSRPTWCSTNQFLTGKSRLRFHFTSSERKHDSWDAALGALPQPRGWGVPCSAGSSWTSQRSSVEPSGGYTKWQPLCWHGYRKGSSLGCYPPLQSKRKWWTVCVLQGWAAPVSTAQQLYKLTITAGMTMPSDGTVSTLHLNQSAKSLTPSIPNLNSLKTNKDNICLSRDRGSTAMLNSRALLKAASSNVFTLYTCWSASWQFSVCLWMSSQEP